MGDLAGDPPVLVDRVPEPDPGVHPLGVELPDQGSREPPDHRRTPAALGAWRCGRARPRQRMSALDTPEASEALPAEPPPPRITMRFREATTELLAMPWDRPLEEWSEQDAAFVELPVGESRHVVRFVSVADE